MTINPTRNWERAMRRALEDGLTATKQVDGTYRVPSKSEPGKFHIVALDAAGHIINCTECQGWNRYGRSNPCKHAGAVAIAITASMGAQLVPGHITVGPVETRTTRTQLFRTGAAA